MGADKSSYRVLGVGVSIESDSAEFLEAFDNDYSWFSAPSSDGKRELAFLVQLDTKADPFVSTRKINNGQVSTESRQSLKGHPNHVSLAYQLVLKRLFEEIEGFLLFHAGVVARDNQALIIAGPPGAGKTTLVLKLLESGFVFFSDDFCPIHRQAGLVYPFPRSLWISDAHYDSSAVTCRRPRQACTPRGDVDPREEPLPLNQQVKTSGGKLPIRPDQISASIGKDPCKAHCLIYLDPGESENGLYELKVGLRQEGEEDFLGDLKKLGKVSAESLNTPFSEWRITYPAGQGLTAKMREFLKKQGTQIWNIYRVDASHPDFTGEPVLTPIPNHEAAFHLLGELKQEPALKSELGGSPGNFFMEVNELLKGISSYRLSVGGLDAMRDLMLQAVMDCAADTVL